MLTLTKNAIIHAPYVLTAAKHAAAHVEIK